MNKRYLFVLLLVGLFPAVCAGQEQLLRIGKEIKLNTAIFDAKVLASVSGQSFAQLLRSKEILALPEEQQTLLLAQKFAEEKHTLPRTRISIEGKVLLQEQYTLAQKIETDLGNRAKRLLENPNTSGEIRRELRQLQYDFSPKYRNTRILDQLNEWIVTHNSWPRNKIKKESPLTFEEQYEVALARHVDYILSGKTSLPAELIEQVTLTRSFYKGDPVSEEVPQPKQSTHYDIWPPIETDAPYPSRPYDFYVNSSLPIDPATGRQVVTGNPAPEEEIQEDPTKINPQELIYAVVDKDTQELRFSEYEILENLEKWLEATHTWPKIIDEKNLALASLQEKQGHYLALQVAKLRQIGDSSYLGQRYKRKMINKYKEWFPTPNDWTLATMQTPDQLYRQMQDWLRENGRWPNKFKPYGPESFTEKDVAEIQLAQQVEAFAKLAHPQFQGKWKDEVIPSGLTVLRYKEGQYANPDLEQFRKLYQEWHKHSK